MALKTILKEYKSSGNMKLYHFNPNDYDEEYYVMTSSKEEALQQVKQYILKENRMGWEKWAPSDIDNLPDKYTIDEYGYGEVIQSEVS